MQKVDLKEGTPEWYAHRNRFFNASESGAVMSCSPFEPRNPAELFDRKMGLTAFSGNFATRRGHELEPEARRTFEKLFGVEYPSQRFVNGRYAASLDGWNDSSRKILEIKCPMSLDSPLFKIEKWQDIKAMAPQYWWQLVHQYHCSGALGAHFMVYHPDDWRSFEISQSDLARDLPELLDAWESFGRHFDANSRPDDGIVWKDDSDFMALADSYHRAKHNLATAKMELDEVEKAIKEYAESSGGKKVIGGGIQVIRSERAGSIDYSEVPEIAGVDLEKYRKPATTFWQIRESKQ